MHRPVAVLLALLLAATAIGAQTGTPPAAPPGTPANLAGTLEGGAVAARIPFGDARPVLDLLHDHLPPDLAGKAGDEIAVAWPGWVARRDAEIRARLARGDEDSVVNLWLYGTTFTDRPPARERELSLPGSPSMADILERRLDDLVDGIASPGSNERLRFARRVVERRGIDPSTSEGRSAVRRFLAESRERVLAEFAATDRIIAAARDSARQHDDPSFEIAAYATIFQDRGLAPDTSMLPAFGVERVLELISSAGVLAEGSVRRVGIVGPGLDFINKMDGFDFYPPQTVQPFAVVDSLVRLGLARAGDVRVTTFDMDARINEHLATARGRAQRGDGYVLQLPLVRSEPWDPALLAYWERLGDQVGEAAAPLPAPATVADVVVRGVRVRPDVVQQLDVRNLNIVVERLERLEVKFDLIVATNVLVYYTPFEQSLALANAAAMLRPGGVFLVNGGIVPAPPIEPEVGYARVTYSGRQYDHFFWYRRE